jgi:mRNA-degrading endonuclease RelE of RelBE toxin-antitoxin system
MTLSYRIFITPTGQRSLKKLSKSLQKALLELALSLKEKPLSGEKLKGSLTFLRSLHTRIKNTDYRIAYEIIEAKSEIVIHYLASRENFYKQLEKLRLKPAR